MVMEKPITPQEKPPRDLLEEKDEKDAKNFRRNLLRKRRTYTRYFEAGLSQVDMALRRVQAYRAYAIVWQAKDDEGCSALTGKKMAGPAGPTLELQGKIATKECGRKEKENLRKYAVRVKSRKIARFEREKKEKERRAALLARKRKSYTQAGVRQDVAEREPSFAQQLQLRNELWLANPGKIEAEVRETRRSRNRRGQSCTCFMDWNRRCYFHGGSKPRFT